jgi:hypothetical protein
MENRNQQINTASAPSFSCCHNIIVTYCRSILAHTMKRIALKIEAHFNFCFTKTLMTYFNLGTVCWGRWWGGCKLKSFNANLKNKDGYEVRIESNRHESTWWGSIVSYHMVSYHIVSVVVCIQTIIACIISYSFVFIWTWSVITINHHITGTISLYGGFLYNN